MENTKKITWYTLAFMAFSTVWGFGNVLNGFEMCIRDSKYALGHNSCLWIVEHICDNASVYFQDLDREIIKHMDIAVLRSEIVQGNTIASLCKCCGNGLQADIVYCADSFCNLCLLYTSRCV